MEYVPCALATHISIVVSRRPRTWFQDQTKTQVKGNWSGTMLIIYIFPDTPTVFRSMDGVPFLSNRFHHVPQIQSNDLCMWGTKPLVAKVKWFSNGMNSPLPWIYPRSNHSHDVINMCIVCEKCFEMNKYGVRWDENAKNDSGGDRKKRPHRKFPFHSLLCKQIKWFATFKLYSPIQRLHCSRWKNELLLCVRVIWAKVNKNAEQLANEESGKNLEFHLLNAKINKMVRQLRRRWLLCIEWIKKIESRK